MTLFYLQDSRSHVGDGLQFWGKDRRGYVTGLDRAEVFTQEEALGHRDTDIPWPKDYIDARTHWGVDHQVMEQDASDALLEPGCRVYVHVPGDWNGNDVYWVGTGGYPACRLDQAKPFVLEYARAEFANHLAQGTRKLWSADYIETIRRRLVHRQDVDIKEALRGTGIKLPKPERQRRPRELIFNCVGCGRFISDSQRFRHGCLNCGASNTP